MDEYTSRRSSGVAAEQYVADEDNWVDALAVCQSATAPIVEKKKNGSSAGGGVGLYSASSNHQRVAAAAHKIL